MEPSTGIPVAPHPSASVAPLPAAKPPHHQIDLSQFPKDVQEALAVFDADGSGTIGAEELAAAGKMYRDSLIQAKRTRIITIVVSVIFSLILLIQFGVMYAAVQLAKDSVVGSNSVMTTKSGATVQLASSQFTVGADGTMTLRIPAATPTPTPTPGTGRALAAEHAQAAAAPPTPGRLLSALGMTDTSGGRRLAASPTPTVTITAKPVQPGLQTAESLVYATMSSDLSVDALSALKWLVVASPTGVLLTLQVQGLVIQPPSGTPPRNGPATFITQYGHVTLVGTELYYSDDDEQRSLFEASGFPTEPAGAITLAGTQYDGSVIPFRQKGVPRWRASPSASALPAPTAPQYRLLQQDSDAIMVSSTLSSLVPGGPASGPLSRARRLKATSIVGTFSGASTVDLEADRLRIFKTLSRTRNSFPNPDPMSLPEPSAAAPELLPSLLPLAATNAHPEVFWGAALGAACINRTSTYSPDPWKTGTLGAPVPFFLVASNLNLNVSLGSVPVRYSCIDLSMTISAVLPLPYLVAAGVNLTGPFTFTAQAEWSYVDAPVAANANTSSHSSPDSVLPPILTYTWLWSGSLSASSAALGGVQGSQAQVLLDDFAPPASVRFAFAEPPTATSALGVSAVLNVTSPSVTNCVEASGPANISASFGPHRHSGEGVVTFSDCSGTAEWGMVEGEEGGATLGGFDAGAYGPLLFFTPHFNLTSVARSKGAGGNWSASAVGITALAGTPNMPTSINIASPTNFAVRVTLADAAEEGGSVDSGESVLVTSESLYYTYTSSACGLLSGAVDASVNIAGQGIVGHGTLVVNTCAPPGAAAYALSTTLGSFELYGQRMLSAGLNASRATGGARWGGLTLAGTARLGDSVVAQVVGWTPPAAGAATTWAFNATLQQPYVPGSSVVDFAASGPVVFDADTGCLRIAAAAPAFHLSLGPAHLRTRAGVLHFDSCTGAFFAELSPSAPLPIGPALLDPSATIIVITRQVPPAAMAAAVSDAAGAAAAAAAAEEQQVAAPPTPWVVTITSAAGSAGPTVSVTSFSASGTEPFGFTGAGALSVSAAAGALVPGSGLRAFNISGVADFTYSSQDVSDATTGDVLCPLQVSGSPLVRVSTALTPAHGPLDFVSAAAAGDEAAATFAYACPTPSSREGAWSASFTTPLLTPAYDMNVTQQLPQVVLGEDGSVQALEYVNFTSLVTVPAAPGMALGPFALHSATVTVTAAAATPTASDWVAVVTATGTLPGEGQGSLTVRALVLTLNTAALPPAVAITGAIEGEGSGFSLSGTLALTASASGGRGCFAGTGSLNATVHGSTAVYGPTTAVVYDSCAPTANWRITSSLVSDTVLLDGGASFSPTSLAITGQSGGRWGIEAGGVLQLAALGACEASGSVTAEALAVACRKSTPAMELAPFFANDATSAITLASSQTAPALFLPTPDSHSTCLQASAIAPLVTLAFANLNTDLANVPFYFASESCDATIGGARGSGWSLCSSANATASPVLIGAPAVPGAWVSGPILRPALSLSGLLLTDAVLQLAARTPSAWNLTGNASAFLNVYGASPSAVTMEAQAAALMAPISITLVTHLKVPTFSATLTLSTAAQAPGSLGDPCTPLTGSATGVLSLTTPPFDFDALPATYNPCTGITIISGETTLLTPLVLGSGAIAASTLQLRGSRSGWAGTLGGWDPSLGSGTSIPRYIDFSETAAVAGGLRFGLALVFPGYGGSVGTTSLTAVCSAGTGLGAPQDSGSGTVSFYNLPGSLPDAVGVPAIFTRACENNTGAFSLNAAMAASLNYTLPGGEVANLTTVNMTATRSAAALCSSAPQSGLSYAAMGLMGDGNTLLTVEVAPTGAVSSSSYIPSMRRMLAPAPQPTKPMSMWAAACDFSRPPNAFVGGTASAFFNTLVKPLSTASFQASVSTSAGGCTTYSGPLRSLFGKSATAPAIAATLNATVCGGGTGVGATPATCTISVPLDLSAMTGLPSIIKDLAAGSFAVTNPVLSITSRGATLTADGASQQSVAITKVSLQLDASSGSTTSFAMTGTGQANVGGIPVYAVIRRSAAAAWSLTLGIDIKEGTGDMGGTGIPFPFTLAGNMTFTPSGMAFGNISALSIPLGSRTLSMPKGRMGSISLSLPGSGKWKWSMSAPMPGANFGGVAPPSLNFLLATPSATAASSSSAASGAGLLASLFGISLSGALPPGLSGLSWLSAGILTVSIPAPGKYNVSLAGALSLPTLTIPGLQLSLGMDVPTCASFAGVLPGMTLQLGSDALTLGGSAIAFDSCTGAVSLALTSPTTLSLLGVSATLSDFSFARASSAAPWVGSLTATTTDMLPLPGAWTTTQSLTLGFDAGRVASYSLAFSAVQGSTFSLNGTMSITPPTSPQCTPGTLNTGSASMSAAVLLPDGSSMPISGAATVSLPCTPAERKGGFKATLTPVGEMPTIDLGAVSARLADPMLTYPGGTSFVFTGTLGGGINFVITTTALPTGASSAVSAVLVAPLSMGEALGSLMGSDPATLVDTPLPGLLDPLLASTMAELTVTVAFAAGAPSSKCLYLQAAVDNLFGGSVGMAGKLCRFSVGGFQGSLGFSLDTGISLPGELKQALSFMWPPVLNLGFGRPPVGMSVGKARMPSLPALKRPGLRLPNVYDGLKGITFAGGFPTLGGGGGGGSNAMGNFVATLGGFPALSDMVLKLNNAMLNGVVTCSFASIKDLSITLMLPSVDGSMRLGGGVELSDMGLMTLISPTSLGAGLTATLRSTVGTGVTLVSSVLMTATVSGPVLSLQLAAAFALDGGSGNWDNPMGMGSGVSVLMPIVGDLAIGITPLPPFLIPTKIAFAGGMRIGSTSARMAFSVDLLKPTNCGFLIDVQNVNPMSMLNALMPIQPSPLAGAESLLKGVLPSVGTLAMSFNPGLSDIVVGVGPVAVFIPVGINLLIEKVPIFGLLTIDKAYMYIHPLKGIAMGASLAPVNLFGIFTMDCGLTPSPCNGLGPSFSLALTPSDQHFCLSGGAALFAGGSPFGSSLGGSSGGLRLALSMCIYGDSTFYLLSTVNVLPSLAISFDAQGRLDRPESISVFLVAELKPVSLSAGDVLGAANAITRTAGDFANNVKSKATEAFDRAKGAFEDAGKALNMWRRLRLRRLQAAGVTAETAVGRDRELFARELWWWDDDDDDWFGGVAEAFTSVTEVFEEVANQVVAVVEEVAREVVNGVLMTLAEVEKLYNDARDAFDSAKNAIDSIEGVLRKFDPTAPVAFNGAKLRLGLNANPSIAASIGFSISRQDLYFSFSLQAPVEVKAIADSAGEAIKSWFMQILADAKIPAVCSALGIPLPF